MPAREQQAIFHDVRWVKFGVWVGTGLLLMILAIVAWHGIEEFLIKDNRFRLAQADDFAGPSPNLIVEGIHYASASQIRHVFAQDFGRSLYLVPIEERRAELLQIDWVEAAAVSKIWPDTLKVHVEERKPVAFVRLQPNRRDGVSQLALIDKDGFILRPRIAARFTLPVITGIRESEARENRRARVRRVLGMLRELGPLAEQISEVNVTDPNDLIIAEHVGSGVVNLLIGDENYADRLQNLLANYEEIKARRPDAKTLDLRVDGAITTVGEEQGGK